MQLQKEKTLQLALRDSGGPSETVRALKEDARLTGDARVGVVCVLVHDVVGDGVLWHRLHLDARRVRQHPQVLK